MLSLLLKLLQSNSSNSNNNNNSNNGSDFNADAYDDPEVEPPDIPEPWTERDYRDYFGVPDDVPFDPDDYFDD